MIYIIPENMSLVSIIVPVHNTVQYIEKCISSITGQTLADIEIIMVENNSTDGSYELCERIAETDKSIKLLHSDIADLSTARNLGINIATSDYIGFVDSDDYIDPNMYSDLYRAAIKYNAELTFCNFRMDFQGNIKKMYEDTGKVEVMAPKTVISGIFNETVSSSACTKLFKKTVFNTWRFPEGHFFEDHDAIYRIIADCCNVCVHIDKSLYFYYQRDNSICHNVTPDKRYHYFLADYNRIAFIRESGIFTPKEQSCLIMKQVSLCINHFKIFLLTSGHTAYQGEMQEMRQKLISQNRSCCSMRDRNTLFRIKLFWKTYYRRHSLRTASK